NTWAATLSAAIGLPIPRTAEAPIAFELMSFDAAEREALLTAHAARRLEFVEGIAADLGAAPSEVDALTAEPPAQLLEHTNSFITQLREHRRWLYVLALLLGAVLHVVGLSLVMRQSSPDARLGRKSTALAAGIW